MFFHLQAAQLQEKEQEASGGNKFGLIRLIFLFRHLLNSYQMRVKNIRKTKR
jgi:hypothetical protein